METHLLDYHCYTSNNIPLTFYLECFAYFKYLENYSSILFSMKSCPYKLVLVLFINCFLFHHNSVTEIILLVGSHAIFY